MLSKHEEQLLEKPNSGVSALLRDDKREDLTRLFRLFNRLPNMTGLKPIAESLRRHIEAEGLALVAQLVDQLDKKKEGEGEG